MGESEAVQAQLDERRAGFDDLKTRYDEAYAAWQHSLGDLREEVAKLHEKQAQIESSLPERMKREFWKVAKQRHNVAVTRVDGDSCSMCRTRVRPQVAQQLKRGEFVTCDGCHRILYMERPAS
jgi:predicted  nucleic acid-binding Zn-ribbon protein